MSDDDRCPCGGSTRFGLTGRVLWCRCLACGAEDLAPADPLDDWMTLYDLKRALRWAEGGLHRCRLADGSSPQTTVEPLPPGPWTGR